MNIRMDDIARQHIREMHHQAASHRSAGSQELSPGYDASRSPGLRRRVGFALVEAGFFLLGTDRLATRG